MTASLNATHSLTILYPTKKTDALPNQFGMAIDDNNKRKPTTKYWKT